MSEWRIFKGEPTTSKTRTTKGRVPFPEPPAWRVPGAKRERVLAATFRPTPPLIDAINAAIYLRRPLLVTGKPGTGKSSLIYKVAEELGLGNVLKWSINSKSVLRDGLYTYDALARLQYIHEQQAAGTAKPKTGTRPVRQPHADLRLFLTLGPLGSALASKAAPRALLVDEIDKSDVDLPNDLLDVLDTGRFRIPELTRMGKDVTVSIDGIDGEAIPVKGGEVVFTEFPLMVMTSNGERDFPGPFLRRCVQFDLLEPDKDELAKIVAAHFPKLANEYGVVSPKALDLIGKFITRRESMALATDQVLNAFHMIHNSGLQFSPTEEDELIKTIFQKLG
jgi:MoxR-like ATPase